MPAGAGWEPSNRALDKIYKINKIFRILTADRGIRDTKAPPTSALRVYGLARQAQETVVSAKRPYHFLFRSRLCPTRQVSQVRLFTRPYPDAS